VHGLEHSAIAVHALPTAPITAVVSTVHALAMADMQVPLATSRARIIVPIMECVALMDGAHVNLRSLDHRVW
jgi:hypothetical protein